MKHNYLPGDRVFYNQESARRPFGLLGTIVGPGSLTGRSKTYWQVNWDDGTDSTHTGCTEDYLDPASRDSIWENLIYDVS